MRRKNQSGWARRSSLRFPLTLGGAGLLLGSGVLLWWTYHGGQDHVIRVIAWSCSALVPLAGMLTWTLGHSYKRRIEESLRRTQLHCGDTLPDGGPFLRIRYLQPLSDEQCRVTRRGCFQSVYFRLHDPFELIGINEVVRDAKLLVLPRRVRTVDRWQLPPEVASGEEWSARGKPDGDLNEIGEYRRGDPLRLVLWKVSARRGGKSLYVRRPETVGDSKLAFYFMAGSGDEATAELFYHMIQQDQLRATDLITFNTDHDDPSTGSGENALQRLAASGNEEPDIAFANVEHFREEALRRRVSACLVFLPEPDAEKRMASFPEIGLPTYFVVGVHQARNPTGDSGDERNLQFILVEPNTPT